MKMFLTKCLFACLIVLRWMPAHSQEVFNAKQSKYITTVPFTMLSGGIILIKAGLDDHKDSLNFILDTGSGGISLDSMTVESLAIPTKESDRTIRGIAGIRKVKFAYNHSLKLHGLSVDSLNFHINDYELLSGVYGLKIDGIIGFSFLQRYILHVNYEVQEIGVFTNGLLKYPKGGHMLRPNIAGLPMQYASLKESRSILSRFYLDTGAGLCLLLSEEFCADSNLLPASRRRYKTVTEGLGGKKDMEMTILRDFKIGPYKFKKIPIYIFSDDYNVTSYPSLAGLIGNDLLRRFNIIINYASREFYLMPNKHLRDPFDYSYTGMGLYADGSEVVISDVVTGSPADRAGLRQGDVVVGMDNNLSNSLQAYKTMLQQAGAKIRLIIKRNDELIETKLSIQSIL